MDKSVRLWPALSLPYLACLLNSNSYTKLPTGLAAWMGVVFLNSRPPVGRSVQPLFSPPHTWKTHPPSALERPGWWVEA